MSDLSAEAKQLVERARETFSPDAEAVRALRASLESTLGAGAFGAALDAGCQAATTPARPGFLAGAFPRLGAGLLLAVLGFGVIWATGRQPSNARRDVTPPVSPPIATPRVSAPAPSAAVVPGLEKPNPVPARRTRRMHPERARQAVTPDAERTQAPVTSPPPIAASPRSAPGEAAAPLEDGLAREITVLRGARAALDRGDAVNALQLLDQHERGHPAGALRQERLATRVLVLCALNRMPEARQAVTALLAMAPRAPYLMRLRASCVGSLVK